MEVHLWRADAALHESDDFRTFKVVAHGFTSTAELHQRLGALAKHPYANTNDLEDGHR